jgi:hypothetical protein
VSLERYNESMVYVDKASINQESEEESRLEG